MVYKELAYTSNLPSLVYAQLNRSSPTSSPTAVEFELGSIGSRQWSVLLAVEIRTDKFSTVV
tara:strand:- start:3653 stop:3838 length:186 start_codon:yes stop_codon:yes gene_type:complete